MAYLNERVQKGATQLDLLRDLAIKGKDRASSIDMPRESKSVF